MLNSRVDIISRISIFAPCQWNPRPGMVQFFRCRAGWHAPSKGDLNYGKHFLAAADPPDRWNPGSL
jgi:hypothetical protein